MTVGDTINQLATAKLTCPRCNAAPGNRCKTKTGNSVSFPHRGRWYAAREEFFVRSGGGYKLKMATV